MSIEKAIKFRKNEIKVIESKIKKSTNDKFKDRARRRIALLKKKIEVLKQTQKGTITIKNDKSKIQVVDGD